MGLSRSSTASPQDTDRQIGSEASFGTHPVLEAQLTRWDNLDTYPVDSIIRRRRKAVLVGINYFGQRGELPGCVDDVRNITVYLEQGFGYTRENMVILTDDQHGPLSQPTKGNILRAMHWLVQDARPYDSLLFYYSGHGGPMPGLDGEESNRDQTIYPVDFRACGRIEGDEINQIMVNAVPSGVRLTLVIDTRLRSDS